MDRLLENARSGSQSAFSRIVQIYRPLIDSMLDRYSSSTDRDDLRQEAMIALYSAVRTYDTAQHQVTFGLYAKICIRNRLISYRRRNRPELSEEDYRYDALRADGADPADSVIEQEAYRSLMQVMDESLSDLEKRVLALYLQNQSYAAIAQALRVSEKTVDNAIYRVKAKLRKRI